MISTIAGTGDAGFGGDGGPATSARLYFPRGLAVAGDGSVFVADLLNHRIRKVTPDGLITTVAGTGVSGFSGDGGPATAANLAQPMAVAVAGDGTLFIADFSNARIRKVAPDGTISTVAGTGVSGFSGDGGPATAANLAQPMAVAVAGDGTLFIADTDSNRIRKVAPDGTISTVAGTGVSGFSGDGGPATAAQLAFPMTVALANDGMLYIADTYNYRVRRIGPDGIITTVAGNGEEGPGGDSNSATSMALGAVFGLALAPDGSLFLADSWANRIYKVSRDGRIVNVAGTGDFDFYGDGGPPTAAALNTPIGVAIGGNGTLFISDTFNQRIRKITPRYPRFAGVDLLLPAPEGTEVYAFTDTGRHVRTLDAVTGARRYEFGHDSEGRLITITDGDNNITTIERDGAGAPTAIVAPDGQRTTLAVDANGYLATITNPAGETNQFTYSPDGLLLTRTTPRNHTYRFSYDSLGRLTRDEDPAGGVQALDRTGTPNNYTVTLTTGLNRASTSHVEPLATDGTRQVDINPDGTQTELRVGTDGTRITTAPDGTVTTLKESPDPRFGMQAPIPGSLSVRLPSGLTASLSTSRTVALSDPNNFLSLTSQTDTVTLNGRTATSTYDAATKTFTDTSPAGRQSTTTIDTQGRVTRTQVDALEPVSFAYDARGRLSTVTQGTGASARTSTFTYNPEGFLGSITDPLSRTVRFTYDAAGRVTAQTLPDLREIRTTYDPNGNVASITPPSRPAHSFGYTPVDLEESYTPPDLGIGNVATTYIYNPDRQLTTITRPDGQTVTLTYDPTTGRLSTLTEPRGDTTFSYHPTSGQVSGIASPGGTTLSYTYDGSLLTGTTWTGPVAGSVTRTYDPDFRVATESVNGGNTVTFHYDDPDSLLTGAGALTLTRNPQHGLLMGTTLGGVTDSYGYSPFGELGSYQASYSGSPLLGETYTRDNLGRITQKVETIGGVTTTTDYGYDPAGRLTDVTVDGTLAAHYEYDGNGNRLSVTRAGTGTVSGTYDNQDRLTTYGAVTYSYTANGDLQTATSGGETTSYNYDVFGNLTSVTLPTGTQIEYVIDGQDRRIGKKVNGVLTQAFLYSGQLRPVAELDGSGAVVTRFVYGTKLNVPEYMIKGGVTYRLLTDHLGSVRLVVDTATGTIAQRLDYDEFGQVTSDTAPGFQPFGFAGGLYDPDTHLTRFGFRDYDPFTGRWTAKDPIRFLEGDTNLFGYTLNDPTNLIDPEGLAGAIPFPGAPLSPPIILPQPEPLTPEQWQQMKEDLRRWFDPRPLGQYLSKTAEEIIKEIKEQYEKRLKESKCEVRTPSQFPPPKKHDPNEPPDPNAPWWKKLIWALGQAAQIWKGWPR